MPKFEVGQELPECDDPAPDRFSIMPSTKSATRYILIALSLLALGVLMWRINEVLIAAFGGIVGAAALRVLGRPLARRCGVAERWGVVLVALLLLGLVGLLAWLFGAQVADEAAEMRQVIPQSAQKLLDTIEQSALGRSLITSTKQAAQEGNPLSGVGLAAGALLHGLADLLLIFFLSLYFALDPGEYLHGFLRLLPPVRRPQVERALHAAGEALQKWLLAQLIAMAVIGVAVGTSLALLGMPLALLLGTIAALLEFVPVIGPIVFTIPGLLVAFTKGPHMVFYVLLVYIAVQQVESNILIPLLQRWAVRLAPVISLLSVLAGGLLFGVMGVVFATPLAVVVTTLVKNLYVEDTLERPRPEPVVPAPGPDARPQTA